MTTGTIYIYKTTGYYVFPIGSSFKKKGLENIFQLPDVATSQRHIKRKNRQFGDKKTHHHSNLTITY